MKETFGEYIHRLRADSGLTLTKLAAALDIDQSTLSKIENGKRNFWPWLKTIGTRIFQWENCWNNLSPRRTKPTFKGGWREGKVYANQKSTTR